MGTEINIHDKSNYHFSSGLSNISYNTKVAIWHLPYSRKYSAYDSDDTKWFESTNKKGFNEIEKFENDWNVNLDKYKVHTKTTTYEDFSQNIVTEYPNGTKITECQGIDYVIVNIKDKNNRIVAEKIYNYDGSKGRKTLYQYIEKDGNIFTIARVFSYDTDKNKKSDIVNFGYTGLPSTLTNGCKLENEYYLLNGKEIKAEKINDYEYQVKDTNGKKLIFSIE